MTPRINRHRRHFDIEILPCTEYFFKVIASEDWKGMREDFKMYSEVVAFKLEYTPKFINPPLVTEKRKQEPLSRAERREQRRREMQKQRELASGMASDDSGLEQPATTEPDTYMIRVSWKLSDVDYPNCLAFFVLDYYDTLYNETGFSRRVERPFRSAKFELEVANHVVPCEQDYEFIIRAFGLNGKSTRADWTPSSCVVTTPAPTTTTMAPEVPETTTEDFSLQLDAIQAENERLQNKIDGLKQEYEKIGMQVFNAFKESFFGELENFLSMRKADTGSGGDIFGGMMDNNTMESTFYG